MEKYELPLVFFTVLSQMSVGMALVLTWRTLRGEVEGQRFYWLVSGLVLALASIAAILHLAHPDRAYNALINLRHAWLSREILGATLFGAAVGVTFLAKGHKAMTLIASVFGVLLVAVQGMTYAAPAMVAIANGFTMLLFFITVWVMGCAAIPLLKLRPAVPALRQGIVVYRGTYRGAAGVVKRGNDNADDGAFMAGFTVLSGKPGLPCARFCRQPSR